MRKHKRQGMLATTAELLFSLTNAEDKREPHLLSIGFRLVNDDGANPTSYNWKPWTVVRKCPLKSICTDDQTVRRVSSKWKTEESKCMEIQQSTCWTPLWLSRDKADWWNTMAGGAVLPFNTLSNLKLCTTLSCEYLLAILKIGNSWLALPSRDVDLI